MRTRYTFAAKGLIEKLLKVDTKRWIAVHAVLLFAVLSRASDSTYPAALLVHKRASALLDRKNVTLSGKGTESVRFGVVNGIIESEHVLAALQQAYDSMRPDGETPEFVISAKPNNQYLYVDSDGESTIIEELYKTSDDASASLYLFMEGERFFGSFEAVAIIRAQAIDTENIKWQIDVHAWPSNKLSRLIARMGIVNRYFRAQTSEITSLMLTIGRYMDRHGLQTTDHLQTDRHS